MSPCARRTSSHGGPRAPRSRQPRPKGRGPTCRISCRQQERSSTSSTPEMAANPRTHGLSTDTWRTRSKPTPCTDRTTSRGVLFWRAFLTRSQADLIKDMLEVERVEHQPRPDPAAKRLSDPAPFFTPSRENKKLDDNTPWPPGKSLYVIWARHSENEKEVRFIDGQLEELAGPENVYVEVYPTQVYFWRAFLTKSQSEILEKIPEALDYTPEQRIDMTRPTAET
ncbi:hypothetical protein PG989_004621 [Apiospora arundinis]